MKVRIILILVLGALVLALFENWRYRAANKDFKTLYEVEKAVNTSNLYASWTYNDAWRAFLNSTLLSEGYIKFSSSEFSYGAWPNKPNTTTPNVSIIFSIERPFSGAQTQELNKIVSGLQTKYDSKVKGLWRVTTDIDRASLRFYIFANSPIQHTSFSRFYK